MQYETISYEIAEDVAIITLSRADVMNALMAVPNLIALIRSTCLAPLLEPGAFGAFFKGLDANDDGVIDWDEFRGSLGAQMEDGHAKLLFKLLDVDGNGVLEKAEVLTAVRGNARVQALLRRSVVLAPLLKPTTFKALYRKIDLNGDGVLQPIMERSERRRSREHVPRERCVLPG